MIPTLFGIMVVNFIVIQAAPGGPVEQMIAKLKGTNTDFTQRYTGAGSTDVMGDKSVAATATPNTTSKYRGARGLDPDLINDCLLYTSPSPRDREKSRMPSSA